MNRGWTVTIVVLLVILGAAIIILNYYPISNNMCNYNDSTKNYVGKSPEQCSTIKFLCVQGTEYFSDSCGCGCRPVEQNQTEPVQHMCPENVSEYCIDLYKPVCGWNDPAKVQCVRYPCAQTYSNECFACQNENVISWSEGACPA